ncbi:uncharacterized protein LOC119668883 [Teleopsis dalmanni]|uniref:uncharacterized protein LOC119668883 n=1 Tax=Teleopsis dalmanni TaxID=139649 RepID=UPI0018CE5458|nr:uncharacterized protein LOC119668883 [Teleopsis dalmanni]
MLHGLYAPLSQVMTTDSDSEEEIHNSSKHRQLQQNNRLGNRNPPNSLALYQNQQQALQLERQKQLLQQQEYLQRQKSIKLSKIANGHNQQVSYTPSIENFRSVMMSDIGFNVDATHCDPTNNFSSVNSDSNYDDRNNADADNVAILGNNDSKESQEPMSPARKFCFIASLVLCAFAVFGFVWLVPCYESSTCPAPIDRIKTHNWFNNYTSIELKGGVNIVSGLRSWENNLIFLYRGDVFFPEFRRSNNKRHGIISLIGSSGVVAWFDELVDEPVAIDCTLVDVDRNGRPDCLILDEYGQLGAINPISGRWLWLFKESSAHKVDALDFPIILPDLDGDGILEILIVTSESLKQRTKNFMHVGEINKNSQNKADRNYLRILSGGFGKPIGEGFKIHDCEIIRKLQLENSETITYNCLRNNTEAQRSKTLSELFALVTNKSIEKKLAPTSKISQYRHYGQRKDIDAQRNIYSLSGRELVVENRGKCPEDCNVTFILSENKNGKSVVLKNFTNTGMYGMVPAQWHFKNTKTKMSGFVMKFWKWQNLKSAQNMTNDNNMPQKSFAVKKNKTHVTKDNAIKSTRQDINQSNGTKKLRRKREHEHDFPEHDFDAFHQTVHKRSAYDIPEMLVSRSLTNISKKGSQYLVDNYKMQMITESEIIVLFIGGDTHIENTSQSDIVQFCYDRKELVCQPDLNNQENSMLIADLDQDNSQELVSYMSTFVQSSTEPQTWNLVTYVRLLRLQSELPAFFNDKN